MALFKKKENSQESVTDEQTTVHVVSEEKKGKNTLRTVLTYVLLLCAGLFIGILFSYLSKL